MWSLVTETRVGEDNRTEALPMTIDPQYTVGFSWARQYGFRIVKNISNKVWVGFSVEDSQETITPTATPPTPYLLGSPAIGGGLYNAAINGCSHSTLSGTAPSARHHDLYPVLPTTPGILRPDFIAKLAFQPGFGHYEIFGSRYPVPRSHLPRRRTDQALGGWRLQQLDLDGWRRRQCPLVDVPEAR